MADIAARVEDLIRDGIDLQQTREAAPRAPFWSGLTALGSELWLDTGDLAAAEANWTGDFSGLTTNNTLLNTEVQKGTYDALIPRLAEALATVDPRTRILEIAFALNARHGLRLVQRFGARVSVELHTDLANDAERSVAYGLRYHAICPNSFTVKLPFTAAGLIAARELGQRGVPINLTLGFSARHNHLTTAFARPAFVNVFLGRLNAYVKDNALGDGLMVGEKALLASQREVRALDRGAGRTRQIAASLRGASQVRDLAGCDVYTMPTAVAAAAKKELDGKWSDRTREDYAVTLSADRADTRIETLWDVSAKERDLSADLAARPPRNADELIERARARGCGDLFPSLSEAERQRIASDGKIPKHAAWLARVRAGELAIDTLLNLAGLASFTADQAALDGRVRNLIGA